MVSLFVGQLSGSLASGGGGLDSCGLPASRAGAVLGLGVSGSGCILKVLHERAMLLLSRSAAYCVAAVCSLCAFLSILNYTLLQSTSSDLFCYAIQICYCCSHGVELAHTAGGGAVGGCEGARRAHLLLKAFGGRIVGSSGAGRISFELEPLPCVLLLFAGPSQS